MAVSRTTRKGNGPGWGGERKGSLPRGEKAAPFEPGNQVASGYHDMSRAERLAALDQRKWEIGMGLVKDAMPVHVNAINSYEDRHQGKAIARNLNVNLNRRPSEYSDEELAALAGISVGEEGVGGADQGAIEADRLYALHDAELSDGCASPVDRDGVRED